MIWYCCYDKKAAVCGLWFNIHTDHLARLPVLLVMCGSLQQVKAREKEM